MIQLIQIIVCGMVILVIAVLSVLGKIIVRKEKEPFVVQSYETLDLSTHPLLET
jgi:hypothetical protein